MKNFVSNRMGLMKCHSYALPCKLFFFFSYQNERKNLKKKNWKNCTCNHVHKPIMGFKIINHFYIHLLIQQTVHILLMIHGLACVSFQTLVSIDVLLNVWFFSVIQVLDGRLLIIQLVC